MTRSNELSLNGSECSSSTIILLTEILDDDIGHLYEKMRSERERERDRIILE